MGHLRVLRRAAPQGPRHPPKSPIAAAIRYADNQWEELGVFLDDERVPLDNNGSEGALRRVALGRKHYLFVQDVERGASIAGLHSLVATCEARGINPFKYLADVLARVQVIRPAASTSCYLAHGSPPVSTSDPPGRYGRPQEISRIS